MRIRALWNHKDNQKERIEEKQNFKPIITNIRLLIIYPETEVERKETIKLYNQAVEVAERIGGKKLKDAKFKLKTREKRTNNNGLCSIPKKPSS